MINHFVAVELRVLGSGTLKSKLYSPSGTKTQQLKDYTMSASTEKSKTLLANFKQERAQLEIKVTEINDNFVINKITIFYKLTATSYPG